ncbi:amine oxidase [Multifurca ochricompacta]|uniref:Amine oxidase n=1 Tax=Multifurca ochricompacta TaxID=376703 RepID=A0AAD4M602_9AGAM|nr:amine oxidase [Multifurca ochricompacta]
MSCLVAEVSSLSLTLIMYLFSAFSHSHHVDRQTVFVSVSRFYVRGIAVPAEQSHVTGTNDFQVLILGGGVAGVMAAETLHHRGIDNFKIIEARSVLGGRMKNFLFGVPGRQYVLELGADWIHGTQANNGPSNPIFDLARKHNLSTQPNHYRGSMTIDYMQTFNDAVENFAALTVGGGERILRGLVDTTTRSGYSLLGAKPRTPHEIASEYYQFDWEYAQTPEQSSWLASSWANNFTFNSGQGGFSTENLLTIDQRGFASIIQSEAAEFLSKEQVLFNATVKTIKYSNDRVSVSLSDGSSLSADYALVTFSLGVLQHDGISFEPALPTWKSEAIHGMAMGTYTKIYLQFPEKFWFDTEFALYADHERGWYPVWQSLDMDGFFSGSGILFVTVTGDFSKRIESLSDEAVKEEVLTVLRSMYPNATIPEPDAFYFPRWLSDPLYRGSYSNWPSSFLKSHHTNLRATVDRRLWFGGEATSLKYFGYLHGAYYEGQKMAEEIAHCIESAVCVGLPHVEEISSSHPYIASDFI